VSGTSNPFDRPLPSSPPTAPPTSAATSPTGGTAAADARAERLSRLAGSRAGSGAATRRAHPSNGARTVALLSSLLATGGVAGAMASADRSPVVTAAAAAPAANTASAATSSAAGRTPAAAGSSRYADGTWTGAAEWTRWGYVQVQAVIRNGKITDIQALQSPSDRRSASINAQAQPILEREAIAAQSADIDMISGATYTSRTYSASLQAALDEAAQAVLTNKAGQS